MAETDVRNEAVDVDDAAVDQNLSAYQARLDEWEQQRNEHVQAVFDEARAERRGRRRRLERIRGWVIVVGSVLTVALMFSPLPGVLAALVILVTFTTAVWLRRAGQ